MEALREEGISTSEDVAGSGAFAVVISIFLFVGEGFIRNLSVLVLRLSAQGPARRVPSQRECGFCDISSADCPERAAVSPAAARVTQGF